MGRIVWGACAAHTAAMMREPPAGEDAGRARRVFGAFEALRASLAAARPDVLVVVATDHFETFSRQALPAFALGQGARFDSWGEYGSPKAVYAGNEPLGASVLADLIDGGFDVVAASGMRLDHAFSCPMGFVMADPQLPILPIYVNCTAPPLPRLARAHAFGQRLGGALSRQTDAGRVAVLGTGGLSHWVGTPHTGLINQTFDQAFLRRFEAGAFDELAQWDGERVAHEAGNGASEVRNWLVAAAAVQATGARRLAYEPVETWRTGIAAVELLLPASAAEAAPSHARQAGAPASRPELEHFLYRFDKDTALQARLVADADAVLASEPLRPEEKRALAARDVATLLAWGIHPLLIRNFAGTLKVDYLSAYRAAGLDTSPPWPDAE